MSSCRGLMYLLVLLGAVFASGKPAQYVPDNLKHALESIADELKLKHPDIGTDPLFDPVIRSINNSCQRQTEMQLMNATLDVYTRIFSSIFQHDHHNNQEKTPKSGVLGNLTTDKRSEVISALKKLQRGMEELKTHLSRRIHKSPEDVYNKLNNMKADDPKVQRKALAEFLQIYQAASMIGSAHC